MEKSEKLEDTILSVMDALGDDSGLLPIEELYRKLKLDYDIDRVTAGKVLVELYRKGRIRSPRYYYVKRLEG